MRLTWLLDSMRVLSHDDRKQLLDRLLRDEAAGIDLRRLQRAAQAGASS
jgi:hypothetical protein